MLHIPIQKGRGEVKAEIHGVLLLISWEGGAVPRIVNFRKCIEGGRGKCTDRLIVVLALPLKTCCKIGAVLKVITMVTMAVMLMMLKMVIHMLRRLGDFSVERGVTKPPLWLCFAEKDKLYDGEGDYDFGVIMMQCT